MVRRSPIKNARYLVAKTCTRCHVLKDRSEYRYSDRRYMPHCKACANANSRRWRYRMIKAGADLNYTDAVRKIQENSHKGADRHGLPIEMYDLEIALDESLSIEERAVIIGRTYFATRQIRIVYGRSKK